MKGNKLAKFLPAVIAIIGVIGVILFARILGESEETIKTDPAVQASLVNPLVTFSTWLLYIAVGITIVLSLFSLVKNPQALKKTVLGLGVLVIVGFVVYMTASDAAVYDSQGIILKDGQAGSVSKWVSTGITYSAVLLLVGGIFFVFDLLKGLIKS